MQELSIISYDLKKCSLTERTAIQRAINGYKDYSYNQAYTYVRKGIIDKIPNIYLNNGVIIVKSQDKSKITSILKRYKTGVKIINLYSKKSLLH
ncbi:MAG: hypothetical protein AABX29_10065 [Nanoarchaeota archaeon]